MRACSPACLAASSLAFLFIRSCAFCTGSVPSLIMYESFHDFEGCVVFKNFGFVFWGVYKNQGRFLDKNKAKKGDDAHWVVTFSGLFFVLKMASFFGPCLSGHRIISLLGM